MLETVVFLCHREQITRERRGYYDAFSRVFHVLCLTDLAGVDYTDPGAMEAQGLDVRLLLDVDVDPRSYSSKTFSSPFPTACFQIDTYHHAQRRARSSLMFDHAFVFHPNFENEYRSAGQENTTCMPHAVRRELFVVPPRPRRYEVGWVGRTDLGFYSYRRKRLDQLSRRFKMNDPSKWYSEPDMAEVYLASKIVVNLSRDDYLQDANLRCFEAMAAGALLLTPMPTELTPLGFVHGEHFVGFTKGDDLVEVVSRYLSNDADRNAIAAAGRDKVLRGHTYDNRVETLVEALAAAGGARPAPFRLWDRPDQHAALVRHYSDYHLIDPAIEELAVLRGYSRSRAWRLAPSILLAFAKKIRRCL